VTKDPDGSPVNLAGSAAHRLAAVRGGRPVLNPDFILRAPAMVDEPEKTAVSRADDQVALSVE
jgi:hypothetical protein